MTDTAIKAALSDFDALWLTLFGEVRGEPVEGQIAVASVIRNRVNTPRRFGASFKAVCLKPMQFSCWNDGSDANHVRLMELATSTVEHQPSALTPRIRQLQYIAIGMIQNQLEDRVKGANHYLTTELFLNAPPKWARGQHPVAYVGSHSFLLLA